MFLNNSKPASGNNIQSTITKLIYSRLSIVLIMLIMTLSLDQYEEIINYESIPTINITFVNTIYPPLFYVSFNCINYCLVWYTNNYLMLANWVKEKKLKWTRSLGIIMPLVLPNARQCFCLICIKHENYIKTEQKTFCKSSSKKKKNKNKRTISLSLSIMR